MVSGIQPAPHTIVDSLQPLNPYGISKNEFDKWALRQNTQPPFWAGMKFFNVYGPNEYHKKRMASVILPCLSPNKKYRHTAAVPVIIVRIYGGSNSRCAEALCM
ncbi:MAG: NAD-dependent epimerase/dehydratase family protein [Bacteroidales bacterium]|nr:NAD-dependent epimerase/dehydratase family protein [Bacteroidales bacterium]